MIPPPSNDDLVGREEAAFAAVHWLEVEFSTRRGVVLKDNDALEADKTLLLWHGVYATIEVRLLCALRGPIEGLNIKVWESCLGSRGTTTRRWRLGDLEWIAWQKFFPILKP